MVQSYEFIFRSNASKCAIDPAKKMKLQEQGRIRSNHSLSHLPMTYHA